MTMETWTLRPWAENWRRGLVGEQVGKRRRSRTYYFDCAKSWLVENYKGEKTLRVPGAVRRLVAAHCADTTKRAQSSFFGATVLGATARRGPRTGAAEIPRATVEAIADTFLEEFSDNCTDQRIKPPYQKAIVGGVAIVEDLATGQPVPIEVILAPGAKAFHSTSLPIVGEFRPDSNQLILSPTEGACLPPRSWRNVLISAAEHELTHAADPSIYRETKRLVAWQRGLAPLLRRDRRTIRRQGFKSFCDYVRSPQEQHAFVTQVAAELRLQGQKMRATGVKGFKSPSAALAAMSPTYREIAKCLLPKHEKRFLKMAARAWESGVIPLAGAKRRRR